MVAKKVKVNVENYYFSSRSKLKDFSTSDTQGLEETKDVRKKIKENMLSLIHISEPTRPY